MRPARAIPVARLSGTHVEFTVRGMSAIEEAGGVPPMIRLRLHGEVPGLVAELVSLVTRGRPAP